MRLLLLINVPISIVFIFSFFSKFPFEIVLTELIVLNIAIILFASSGYGSASFSFDSIVASQTFIQTEVKIDNSIQTQVKKWCQENGWTDLFVQKERFYAFPPSAVIPLPIPIEVTEKITRELRRRSLLFLLILFSQIVIIFNNMLNLPLWLALVLVIFLGIFILINELWDWLCFYKE